MNRLIEQRGFPIFNKMNSSYRETGSQEGYLSVLQHD